MLGFVSVVDPEQAEPARIAVLASGQGSTFAALVQAGRRAAMPADVVLLITSRSDAPALQVADELGIEHLTLDDRELGAEECDRAMEACLLRQRVDLIVLAGFVRKVGPRVLDTFAGQILNTHPAPLPRFGGTGMYGEHVHRAVLDAGVSESAATVHLVDCDYDTGPVIAAQPVPVFPGDDVLTLRARVQEAERELLITTVRALTAACQRAARD